MNQWFGGRKGQLPEQRRALFPFTAAQLQDALRKRAYYLDEWTARKIALYLALGKPVGLRGEPGVGKSELAQQVAALLDVQMIDIECHSQLEAQDIGVSWNGFKQIVDAQSGRLEGEAFTPAYLNHTPLLTCLLSESPVVLRVDEVDKLNEQTSNFFLRFLDKREIIVHDLQQGDPVLRAKAHIHVFLTSNEYRQLDPAFMRRVGWVDLSFPEQSQLAEILAVKVPLPEEVSRRLAYLVFRLRALSLRKRPSIGEAIEWARAMALETDGQVTLSALRVTLGLLLKYQDDERKGWEELKQWSERGLS